MIENIQIQPAVGSANGVKLVGGAAPVSPTLHWATWYGTDLNSTFRVETRFNGVPKGGTGGFEGMRTEWSAWKAVDLPASECRPTSSPSDDMTHWSVPLSRIFDVSEMTSGGVWSYDARLYDQVQCDAWVTSVAPGGGQPDQTGSYRFYFEAFPRFEVTDLYMQGEWLVVAYDADGWTRKDDRWEIVSFTKGGRDVLAKSWGTQAGRVEKLGWITVPRSAMQQQLQEGDRVSLDVRWNAAYRTPMLDWASWKGALEVSGNGTANRPTGGVTVNPDGSISVDVGDSGSGGGPIDSWQVTIQGGGTEFDSATVQGVSPNALLKYPPLDVPVTVQIQGSTATGGTSDVVEQTVTVPSGGVALFDPVGPSGEREGEQVRAAYNLEWDRDASRDKETVKFAGRARPSAAFGDGGEASVSAKWTAPWKGGVPDPSVRALADAGADDAAALRELGIEVVYDLRKEAERTADPEPFAVREMFEVRTCPVDLQDDEARTQETKARHVKAAYGRPGERMLCLYGVMADHADAVRDIAAAILHEGRPALVHCANGKDRVGAVCASVQLACGVSRDAVYADYLLTNECNAAMNRRDLAHYAGLMPPDAVEVLAAMFEARAEYLDVFVDAIEARYGSVERWIGKGGA